MHATIYPGNHGTRSTQPLVLVALVPCRSPKTYAFRPPSGQKPCKLRGFRPPSDQRLCKLQRFRSPNEQKPCRLRGFHVVLHIPMTKNYANYNVFGLPMTKTYANYNAFGLQVSKNNANCGVFTWFYISMRYLCDPELFSTTVCRAMFLELQISLNKMRPKPCKKNEVF